MTLIERLRTHFDEVRQNRLHGEKSVTEALCNEAADRIEALETQVTNLKACLDSRDEFIVNQGLWDAYVATLGGPTLTA